MSYLDFFDLLQKHGLYHFWEALYVNGRRTRVLRIQGTGGSLLFHRGNAPTTTSIVSMLVQNSYLPTGALNA